MNGIWIMWEILVAINLPFGYSLEHQNRDDLGMIYDIGFTTLIFKWNISGENDMIDVEYACYNG